MHFVYILFSQNLNSFYIGETTNVEQRLQWHNDKEFSGSYTKRANDWKILFQLTCMNVTQAKKIETHIKSMKSRKYLENMILFPEISQKLLLKYS